MKATCTLTDLKNGLSANMSLRSNRRASLPIYNNVLLETGNDYIRIASFDGETYIYARIKAQVDKHGPVCLPSELLYEYVKLLESNRSGEIALESDEPTLKLSTANQQAIIRGIAPEEFPDAIKTDNLQVQAIEIPSEKLVSAIAMTEFCSLKDYSRPVLGGLKLHVQDGKMTIASADGYRLTVWHEDLENTDGKQIDAILPADVMSKIADLLRQYKYTGMIELKLRGNGVLDLGMSLNALALDLQTHTIIGPYPQYESLILQTHKTSAVFKVAEMLAGMRTLSVIGKDSYVKVALIDKEIRLNLGSSTGDHNGSVALDARTEGDAITFGINPKYVLDFLATLDPEESVSLLANESRTPVMFSYKDTYKYVVMPAFL